MITMADIEALLDSIEQKSVYKAPRRIKRDNRPNVIAIRSSDGQIIGEDSYFNPPRAGTTDFYNPTNNQNQFYNFTTRLPRPALEVKGLQLMSASIPQANARFPETALVFWYYRLSKYSGNIPSLNNLYCVRLLPTFYKPEFVPNHTKYGFNKTFNNYKTLSDELTKSCKNDLMYDNYMEISLSSWGVGQHYSEYKVPYIPGDISLSYNSSINKFQMTGNNTRLGYIDWGGSTIYTAGDIVVYGSSTIDEEETFGFNTYESLRATKNVLPNLIEEWVAETLYIPLNVVEYEGKVYQCLVENTGVVPLDNPTEWLLFVGGSIDTFWKRIYIDVAQIWDSATQYKEGQWVRYRPTIDDTYDLYHAQTTNNGLNPAASPEDWDLWNETQEFWYSYVPTGPEDENVRKMMGTTSLEWTPTTLYSVDRQQDIMAVSQHKGYVFSAYYSSQDDEPIAGLDWSSGTEYRVGDILNYGSDHVLYRSLNPYSAVGDWSDATLYSIGDKVLLDDVYYEATESNLDVNPSITMLGEWLWENAYDVGNWVLYKTGYKSAVITDAFAVGGVASYTTTGHNFVIGDVVSVSGLTNPAFNTSGTITYVEGDNFQFACDFLGSVSAQDGLAVVDPLNSPAIGYRCIANVPGGATIPPTWDYEQYVEGDYVVDPFSTLTYRCTATTTGINPLIYPTRTSVDDYVVGSRVKWYANFGAGVYNFLAYEALVAGDGGTLGEPPNANWQYIETALPPYQATSQWEVGDPIPGEPTPDNDPTHWVSYGEYLSGNTIWRRLPTNIGHEPGSPSWETWWEQVNTQVLETPGWNSGTPYAQGELIVDSDLSLYRSLVPDNLNHEPNASPTFWELVRERYAWRFYESGRASTGLYSLSRLFDMYEESSNTFPPQLLLQYPYGIAGQPYVANPKRLLNTILGFTWNGLFKDSDFLVRLPLDSEGPIPLDTPSQLALPTIYNRMRPIPRYLIGQEGLLSLGDTISKTSQNMTYTAESFCNLVYSSIVAIYTDIIGPSTVDTTRDTNLLAITSMNAASLGVSFWNAPLEAIVENENDGIYGIYIELRDEFDEPYFLPNNAVVVLTFKVHY